MIADDAWVDGYVEDMRGLLGGAFRRLSAALERGGVSFVRAGAGFFVLLDLRRFLRESTWAGEHELWMRILDGAGVNLTPGAACHVGEPGFFRLCYAGLPTSAVEVGVERIARLLG
jgi:1-aminocyclopropane-1-carboxylate synthase